MITLVQTTSTQLHWKHWSQLSDKNLAHSLSEQKKKILLSTGNYWEQLGFVRSVVFCNVFQASGEALENSLQGLIFLSNMTSDITFCSSQ